LKSLYSTRQTAQTLNSLIIRGMRAFSLLVDSEVGYYGGLGWWVRGPGRPFEYAGGGAPRLTEMAAEAPGVRQ